MQKRHRETHTLPPPLRQAVNPVLGILAKTEIGDRRGDERRTLDASDVGQTSPVVKMLANGHAGIQSAVARAEVANPPLVGPSTGL